MNVHHLEGSNLLQAFLALNLQQLVDIFFNAFTSGQRNLELDCLDVRGYILSKVSQPSDLLGKLFVFEFLDWN
jgi:hypothetical protein